MFIESKGENENGGNLAELWKSVGGFSRVWFDPVSYAASVKNTEGAMASQPAFPETIHGREVFFPAGFSKLRETRSQILHVWKIYLHLP